jgi:RimJ/RimL family protein N-acetyltransferase
MKTILETERLLLRELTLTDTAFIIDLVNSDGWLQYIGDRKIRTAEDARTYLGKGPLKSYAENGFGLWLIALKPGNEPIGICGLIKREGLDDVDIGFALLPGYEGKGYVFEVAEQTLVYGREKLRIPHIVAITTAENDRSVRLLKRLGMEFTKNIRLGDGEEMMLFE